ncbi:hypothetical protein GCM10010252_76620 [Streptomyces aureoverticillatus]|nr:hypothetical protein GCM10010252_76620 [Streptomyces aureoverticillatus]
MGQRRHALDHGRPRRSAQHVHPPGPPAADPGITDDERRVIAEMRAKGTYSWILLATPDLGDTFAKVVAGGAEAVQESTEQPYGVRDCAFRDPAGNLVRIPPGEFADQPHGEPPLLAVPDAGRNSSRLATIRIPRPFIRQEEPPVQRQDAVSAAAWTLTAT